MINTAVSKLATFRLLGDFLLSSLDKVHAVENDKACKDLSATLDGHQYGPEACILVNRFNFADFLDILEAYKDHAEEHGDTV